MLLRKNETHEYNAWFDTPRRCRVRLGLPAEDSGHDAFIVISTDGNQTEGANITKAVESLAVPLRGKFDIPPERTIDPIHVTILGKPEWEHTDKKSVEELIDCPPCHDRPSFPASHIRPSE